jgi:twitching motility protein PilT
MPRIDAFLKIMKKVGASDLHILDGDVPHFRINGVLERTQYKTLSVDETRILLYEFLTDSQIETFEKRGELDIAYTLDGFARFRINIFKKYPGLAATFRLIPHEIPDLDSLGFPPVVKKLLNRQQGLILVTGPTNSGKSTTLAAMVDYLNEGMNYHIITLEDPLEFIHSNKNCLINQRQIGEHSLTFANALRASLREDPNVILVGEMRDRETISLALQAAEIGLLVLATLHTRSSGQTIDRLIDSFSAQEQQQVRASISETLIGISSQQLLRRTDGSGRVAAIEILVNNLAIRNLIRESKTHMIRNAIMTGRKVGMQLLDQHLKDLVSRGVVSVEEAARYATDPQEVMTAGKDSTAASSRIGTVGRNI